MRRRPKLSYSIRYDETNLNRRVVVRLTPAKHRVVLTRAAVDVLSSKRGSTVGCTNSNCALREGAAGKFPHPVYMAVFTKTAAYIVDKVDKNGQPYHAVWYKHRDRTTVAMNDEIVDRKELLQAIRLDTNIILTPPVRRATGSRHEPGPRSHGTKTRGRVTVLRGAKERAVAAGLLVLEGNEAT